MSEKLEENKQTHLYILISGGRQSVLQSYYEILQINVI